MDYKKKIINIIKTRLVFTEHTVELGFKKVLRTGKIDFLYPSFFYPSVHLNKKVISEV